MASHPLLTGYHLSVYTRAARIALMAKQVAHDYDECDPFLPENENRIRAKHPFGRVPVLEHAGFRIWETQAILDYIDTAFPGDPLRSGDPKTLARMRQVMGIVDSYVYWPLVRQAFVHAVFHPLVGEESDASEVQAGLAAAPRVLRVLDEIAAEGLVIVPGRFCLSDCMLWPMLDYFRMVREGNDMLTSHAALYDWVSWFEDTELAQMTRPALPKGGTE